MNVVLVDTSFWYAWFDLSDSLHDRAVSLWDAEKVPRIVTPYCLSELVTLISRRADPRRAAAICRELRKGDLADVLDVTAVDETVGLSLIEKFSQLHLSYADATACALVRRLDIPRILARLRFSSFGVASLRPRLQDRPHRARGRRGRSGVTS